MRAHEAACSASASAPGATAWGGAGSGGGTHVDLYAYTSLAVAALQEQAKRIEALEREVKELTARAASRSRSGRP